MNLPDWRGQTVAVLASGPSMSQSVTDAVRHLPVIVVNDTYKFAPWATVLYGADDAWWRANPDAMQFAGRKMTVGNVPGVERLHNTGSVGFDPTPGCVRTGSNSGFQGLHIAIQAGAARILLCGFDMSAARGAHWFGPHRAGLVNTEPETYARFIARFATLQPALDALGIHCDIVNVTPNSALGCFRRSTLEAELATLPERGQPCKT